MSGQAGTYPNNIQAATQPLAFQSSIFTLDDTIQSRALALTGMSRQFSYWSDPFIDIPGNAGSKWSNGHSNCIATNSAPGGVLQLFSNASYGTSIIDPNGHYPFAASPYDSSFFGPVSKNVPSYMFFRFRVMPDPGTGGPGGWVDVEDSFILGMVDPFTLECAGVGRGINGTPFFGAVGGDVTNLTSTSSVPTTVPFDFSVWHDGELFTRLGHWWVIIDNSQPVDCGAVISPTMVRGIPIMQVMANGVLQPAIEIDHCAYAAISNRNLIALQPGHPYP